jgi:murein DD-endopeptidase MepM/ murein hydrolase activator NlpD
MHIRPEAHSRTHILPARRLIPVLTVIAGLLAGLMTTAPALAAGPTPPATNSAHGDGYPWAYIDAHIEELNDLALRRELATRPTVITYTVQSGDTVSGIARQFGLDVDTIRWSNPSLERNPDYLRPGADLTILPVRGVYHQVVAGDSLEKIATRYGVMAEEIANYPLNHLAGDGALHPGDWIIVPHGSKTLTRPRPALDSNYLFAWPLVGAVTQEYGSNHRAIDIGAPYGSSVYAARAGSVIHASWAATGYGYTVIIDHGDSYRTLYSHLKGAWVSAGQWVARGQLIGEVGSTGNSTGPHCHFEIRVDNVRSNPRQFLSPR